MHMDEQIVLEAARFLEDKKAERVIVLDIKGLTSVTDYFIIASGEVQTQLDSYKEQLTRFLAKEGYKPGNRSGEHQTGWVLLDFGAFVVHLLTDELREFYNLERIWGEGTVVWPGEQ